MVVKRIPCDFSQSMYVSQGTYKSNDIVGRKRQIGTKFFSPAEIDTLTDFDAVFKVAHKKPFYIILRRLPVARRL